ncbi:AraC family transcriptional regulator [Paraburkholderia eburnea]|uniref:AraC family transcriptional regulator n=1 Tax=Paraburkholderia eburnea TaxID=1189126 RepID=A0A2S4LTY1_9BURK|nr:AraC family transcriptional regulator [Paraburkholderia eburnea]POR45906.1 AraC family transcriptional regulator [Paraburkholderia eburnea]PRZ15034.1 AraC family transcriptional regulator [Paraburkholderia eburnea]
MTRSTFRDSARYWRSPLLPGAELLTAEYHDHEFTAHWHDAYTVPVIEEGAECYRYSGAHHVADAGSVPVINPGELHTGARAVDEGWRYRVMYVPVDYLHALANGIADRPQPLPWFDAEVIRDLDLARRLSRAHRLMEAHAAHGLTATPADPLTAEDALIDALSTLLTRHGRTRATPLAAAPHEPRVDVMKALLAADLTAPLRVADLAQAIGLSPFHATRLFTHATGLPPHAWRTQLRLQRALAPLRAGVAVADVAAAQGFTDQSHFTRHFRRMFGVPPGRWQMA